MFKLLLNKLFACVLVLSLGAPVMVNARKVTDYSVYEKAEADEGFSVITQVFVVVLFAAVVFRKHLGEYFLRDCFTFLKSDQLSAR